jgi:hypothetical protein
MTDGWNVEQHFRFPEGVPVGTKNLAAFAEVCCQELIKVAEN